MLKIATWNVNSIKMRLERLAAFLKREEPDFVCLQELKCTEENFPFEPIAATGYTATVFGQKTYNGVAVLSRKPIDTYVAGLPTFGDDPSARFLIVKQGDLSVASAYIPNGQEVGSEKYHYKLKWFQCLERYLKDSHRPDERILIAGDFNVAPEDRDVHDPEQWRGKILFSDPEKEALQRVCRFGLYDTFRKHHAEAGLFSWWDYRQLAFPKNLGLRIDFILASKPLFDACTQARIDRDERKGKSPSDHAPVIANFE